MLALSTGADLLAQPVQADKPIWRNNWGVAFTGDITVPSYNVGLPAAQLAAAGDVMTGLGAGQ